MKFIKRHPDQVSFISSAKIILREPVILLRMGKFLLNKIQIITLPDYGKFPQNAGNKQATDQRLNSWAILKEKIFPRGWLFPIVMIFYISIFIINWNRPGIESDLATVGLPASLACLIDMGVALLGEGRADLIKHLLLANFLFDIATIMAISCLGLMIHQFFFRRSTLVNAIILA